MPDSPDLSQRLLAQLRFPCGDVPEPGDIKNVAPGIYWLRMPLPFQLNHINLWLVEDKDGWTIVDTGINTQDMSAIAARNDFIENEDLRAAHLARNGVPADRIALFHRHKGGYAKGVVPLPPSFQRLIHAHPISLGGHRWDV